MPDVFVDLEIAAPIDRVWETIQAIDAYPTYMDNVQEVAIIEDDGVTRVSSWSTLLKGSVLQWTERETVQASDHRIEFVQVDGDLDVFTGFWQLSDLSGGRTRATMSITFEIGIPLLADMLNPVAVRALHENSERMLRQIEQRVA